jgi:hypothetical protein
MNDNSLKEQMHERVQHFLTKFKHNNRVNESFPFQFRSNPNVFSIETQVPDIWIKTRQQLDKNNCFIIEPSTEHNALPKPNLFPQYIYF